MQPKQLICFLLLFSVAGCSKQSPLNFEPISAWNLEEIAHNHGFPAERGRASDISYILPTNEWVEELNSELRGFLFQEGLRAVSQAFDCEDFTREARALAVRKYYKIQNKPLNTAILFGEVSYVKTNGVYHTINFTIVKENDILKLKYYEPQLQNFVTLTPEEKSKIFDWRF